MSPILISHSLSCRNRESQVEPANLICQARFLLQWPGGSGLLLALHFPLGQMMSASPIYWCSPEVWILKGKNQAYSTESPSYFIRPVCTEQYLFSTQFSLLRAKWLRPTWTEDFLESDSQAVPKRCVCICEGWALAAELLHRRDLLLSSFSTGRKSNLRLSAASCRNIQVEGCNGSHSFQSH